MAYVKHSSRKKNLLCESVSNILTFSKQSMCYGFKYVCCVARYVGILELSCTLSEVILLKNRGRISAIACCFSGYCLKQSHEGWFSI